MKFIDICAGIGGFRLGLEQAGHKCIGFIEKDKFAVKSYQAMYNTKGEFYHDDITTIRSNEIPTADAWCFGFPCQDISVAGKQRGLSGSRSGLFFNIIKLVKGKDPEDRPEWLLVENVKNLLSIDGGGAMLTVLSEMDKEGYDCEWEVFNSKDFGVPQNRERVFIIGHLRTRGRREILSIRRENGTTPKKIIGGSQSNRVYSINGSSACLSAQGGGLGAKTGLYLIDMATKGNIKITENARCLQARYNKGMSNRPHEMSGVLKIGNVNPSERGQNGNVYNTNGVSPTLTTNKGEGLKILAVLTPDRLEKRQNGRRFKENEEPMFTLTGQDRHGVYDNARIRRLTPRECFRLQGFPDELFNKAKEVNSDSQLYKQAGNAVTVNVAYEIGRRIE